MLHILQWKSYVCTCTEPAIRKFYLLKNILAYCGYSLTFPLFLLLSEHKHCDKAATNSNSENARSRMVASLRKSVATGTEEHESSTGHSWAVGFHHVKALSRLARVLKLMNLLFLQFSNFFQAAVNHRYWFSRYGGPHVHKILFIYIYICFTFVGLDNKQKYFAHNHMPLSLCLWIK